jgi:hypothetical protein
MDLVRCGGWMVLVLRDNGIMESHVDKESSFLLRVKFMKAYGTIINRMV